MNCPAGSCQFYSMKPIVFAVVLTFLGALQIIPPAALAQQSVTDFMYGGCNEATYMSNDSFAQNLDAVVKSLTHNSSQFLYSLASSETGSQSNYVYGVYQCRGDVSLSDCTSCVNSLTALQTTGSSNACGALAKGVRMQFVGCFFRYENYKFYTGFEKDGVYSVPPKCTGSSNDSSTLYKQNLAAALEDSATAAPQHALFGYNASSVGSGSNTAYALTQCYGYLNSSQCADCVSQVSNYSNTCNGSVSGQVFFNSCYYLFGNSPLVFTYNDNAPPSVNSPANSAPPSQAPAAITSSSPSPEKSKNHTATIVGIVVGVSALLILITALYFFNRRKTSAAEIYKTEDPVMLPKPGAKRFSLKELEDATDNFHPSNKLGQGGFGPVYQGRLKSGIEVAIKMLSAQSHQGKTEFVNEVNLITTVQHRNLIQLLGCCVEDNKTLLVYEYLPNRSLDLHLFDVDENNALDWHTRFDLIIGIARGLKYLHEDSPVRIIHRDIKASNILLDNQLNPKISDFGLARLFADDRTHVTTRVIGTLGYLAPEYAISGQLTEKADVYSFGLVALEIVSGRRVVENKFEDNKQNILDWTWALYEKKQQLYILDKRMKKNGNSSDDNGSMQVNAGEAIRVVHVALLCTQIQAQLRPHMSEVYNMLCGQSEILNLPTKPITIAMLSPIPNLQHDGNAGMLSSGTMPSWTSQPSSVHSYDAGSISQVEPR